MKSILRKKPYLSHIVHCPGSSRTRLFFAVVRRGHVQDTEVILYYFQGVRRRGSLLETKGPSIVQLGQCNAAEGMVGYGQLSGGFSMGIVHFLYPLSPVLLLLMSIFLSHCCFQ